MTEPEAVVRAYTDAWLAGDLAAVVDLYHDDLVLHYGGAHSLTGDHVGQGRRARPRSSRCRPAPNASRSRCST